MTKVIAVLTPKREVFESFIRKDVWRHGNITFVHVGENWRYQGQRFDAWFELYPGVSPELIDFIQTIIDTN